MREILFKAKREDTGEWVEGYYVRYGWTGKEEDYIVPVYASALYAIKVNPDTVCEFTGLTDKNGKRIFEGDIVSFVRGSKAELYLVCFNNEISMMNAVPIDGIEFNGFDYWNSKNPQFDYSTFCLMIQDPYGDFSDIGIIGNRFDNPELLEAVK